MSGLIIPKTYVELDGSLVFLAGPIRGAPNWQDDAASFLLAQEPDLTIASPRREVRPAILDYVLKGDEKIFSRQRAWERYYLDVASETGAILFWLPGEVEHKCEKPYGAMTRKELGDWSTAYKLLGGDGIRFCIGSDGKFSELNILRYDLSQDAPDKNIFETLEDTCLEAIRLAKE